jgi:hypothetical protein
LVEILFALGLLTFVLVTILGLFTLGLTTGRESEDTLEASNLSTAILGRLRANPEGATVNPLPLPKLTYNAAGGETQIEKGTIYIDEKGDTAPQVGAKYSLYYEFNRQPSGSASPATVYLRLGWPVPASGTKAPVNDFKIVTGIAVRTSSN